MQITRNKYLSIYLLLFIWLSPMSSAALWEDSYGEVDGWKYTDWLGWFYSESVDSGWLYHEKHGWLFASGENIDSIWLWSESFGWLWTSFENYPSFFSDTSNSWILYLNNSKDPRMFYDYATETWFTDSTDSEYAPYSLEDLDFELDTESELDGVIQFNSDGRFILHASDSIENTHADIMVEGLFTYSQRAGNTDQADLKLTIDSYSITSEAFNFQGTPHQLTAYLVSAVELEFQLVLTFDATGEADFEGTVNLTDSHTYSDVGSLSF